MSSIVLDASAALAFILNEPGGQRVRTLLVDSEASVLMSAVNWCETLTRLQRDSPIINAGKLASMLPVVAIIAFGEVEAARTAGMAKSLASLSLGDRACLALTLMRGAKAWTTDKAWARMKLPVELEILR